MYSLPESYNILFCIMQDAILLWRRIVLIIIKYFCSHLHIDKIRVFKTVRCACTNTRRKSALIPKVIIIRSHKFTTI